MRAHDFRQPLLFFGQAVQFLGHFDPFEPIFTLMDLLFISISGNKSTPILIIIACPPIYKFLQIQYLSCQPSRPFFSAKRERKKGLGLAETVEVKLQAMEEPRPYLPSEGSPGRALGLNEKVKILTSPPFPPPSRGRGFLSTPIFPPPLAGGG